MWGRNILENLINGGTGNIRKLKKLAVGIVVIILIFIQLA